MSRTLVGLAVACALVAPSRLGAQQSGPAPEEARELVFKVASRWIVQRGESADTTPKLGAGVIVGVDDDRVYLVTAKHVVRARGLATEVTVTARHGGKTDIPATIVDTAGENIDLAVLTVARVAVGRIPALDRRGDPNRLRFNDPVSPMGCPNGICWGVPAPADRVIGIVGQDLIVQSQFIAPGSSGGALFNQYWEVVGVVTGEQPPRANALDIDLVVELVRGMKHPVSLRRAKVPRAGYAIHLGALVLAPLSNTGGALGAETRFPSGRVVASRRGDLYGLTWHLSGLRLAPRNLTVTAGMGGVGLGFRWGPLTAQPFVEVGLGRVEGRWDAEGYVEAGGAYVPLWRKEKQDGLGIGAGLSLLMTIAPHLTVEALAGHWSFNRPDNIPALPGLFAGGGVRLGL